MSLNDMFHAAMRKLVDEVVLLVRYELRTAGRSALTRISGFRGAFVIFAAAVLLTVLAAVTAVVGAALLLATFLPLWLATLIVAVTLGLGAAILFRQLEKAITQARRPQPKQIAHLPAGEE